LQNELQKFSDRIIKLKGNKAMQKLKQLTLIITGIMILLIFLSSLILMFEMREKVITKIDSFTGDDHASETLADHKFWAQEILKGGYILHFRHAERDKWIDVQMYDALESDVHSNGINGTRYAENDFFAQAVCLNARGKVQAQAMGEHIKNIKLPIGKVITSPSCRSRQTANLSFGGYSEMFRILVHKGPYNENQQERVKKLRDLYLNIEIQPKTNTIVSAHNGVVNKGMFSNYHSRSDLYLEEGGFYVISQKNGELHLEHEFHYFKDFMKQFYKR